jgi:ABC-type transporter Mla maintaining outer membrane lipid asymmetry permease subunit MlaE
VQETNKTKPHEKSLQETLERELESDAWLDKFLGYLGLAFKNWLFRRLDQAALGGRLLLVSYWGILAPSAQRRLIRGLILYQLFEIFKRSALLLSIFGLMMGILWTVIWFDILENVPGSTMLASLLITVHLQEITPILTTMVVIMSYCGPMAMELSFMKCSGDFTTLTLMGIPPERVLAQPRILAVILAFPGLMLIINTASILGAFWGVTKAINLPFVEYLSDLFLALAPYKIILLLAKVFLTSSVLGFVCVYNAFQIDPGAFSRLPGVTRRAMTEAFFYATLVGVLVTVFY